jgi:hypothetical protein
MDEKWIEDGKVGGPLPNLIPSLFFSTYGPALLLALTATAAPLPRRACCFMVAILPTPGRPWTALVAAEELGASADRSRAPSPSSPIESPRATHGRSPVEPPRRLPWTRRVLPRCRPSSPPWSPPCRVVSQRLEFVLSAGRRVRSRERGDDGTSEPEVVGHIRQNSWDELNHRFGGIYPESGYP